MDRTAVLIIDSLDVDRVASAVASGDMPNLGSFLDQAAFTRSRNVTSHRSEMAWAQLLSGGSASEIAWHGWWKFLPDSYETVGTGAPMVEPFYARDPVDSIILDAIQSHPRSEVPGSQLFAWGAHSPQFARSSIPSGLFTEAIEEIGPSRLFGNDHPIGWYDDAYLDALGNAATDDLARRSALVDWCIDRTPDWSFLLTAVSEYHAVAHHAWHGADPEHILADTPGIESARAAEKATIRAVDAHVGSFLESVDDATVVIGALHGFQAADDLLNSVLLPELFHRLHFGRPALRDRGQERWRAAGMPPVIPRPNRHWSHTMQARFVPSVRDIPRACVSAGPGWGYDLVRRLRGKPRLTPRHHLTPSTLTERDLDDPGVWNRAREDLSREVPHWYRRFWPEMRAFAIPSFDDGRIRINLQGRERDGVVALSDYEDLLHEIQATLNLITDARTGGSMVADVIFDRLDDPFAVDGPDADVVVRWRASTDAIEHRDVGMIGPHPFMRSASHREDGWFAVAGESVPRDRSSETVGPLVISHLIDGLRRGQPYEEALSDALSAG